MLPAESTGREDDISRPTRAILSMGRNFAGSKMLTTWERPMGSGLSQRTEAERRP